MQQSPSLKFENSPEVRYQISSLPKRERLKLCYNRHMYKHSHNYNEYSLNNAKNLRTEMTLFEQKLWYYLRAKRFYGLRFRRQVPIGNYIVDFICKDKNLIIELDGSGHLENEQTEHDAKRDKYLENLGFKILRIYNNDINDINAVLQHIKNNIL